ncbi:MAG: hypothetical protein D6753_00565 [Planctomycetota bacterium]|nr:MAG: hypothetical protein D6753_00565 [Planctomycetota bacterium]
MAPPKADARPATPALPAASVRSAGLPDPGDLANAPRRIDVAGGRPAPPPAASMPVIGVPSTGSPTPRSAPRPSPDTALERSSLAGPAHGAAPSPGQMAAAQWSGRLRPAIGREPRGTLQPIAADGQAATADVAALFGTGKSFERSVAGLAAPIGGRVASPTASVTLPTDAADNEHAQMDAASDTDRPPVEPTAVGPQSLAALSAAPPATPMADHIADNELLEQGVRRLAVAPGSAGTSGENSGAAAASQHNSLFGRSNYPATAPPSSLAGPPSAQSPTPDDASGEPTSSERARSEPAALARRSDQHSGVRRDSATALINPPLQIDAERGAGGVEVAPQALGTLLARNELRMHAEPETDLRTQRFPRAALGGPLTAGTPAPAPTPAFQQRLDRLRDPSTSQHRATQPQTELAIERGLEFLARYQRPDGSWRLQDFDTRVLIRSDTAATGLALLAFQGAGYTHLDLKYADVVGKAIEYLRTHQQPNGDLYVRQDPASDQNAWLYSHAIAALALTESYGMTQDPEIRPAAQRAVDFITAAQDTRRGGWRYRPGAGSDTSVSGWFMMALQSARLAGLDAPQSTIDRLHNYLDQSQAGPEQPYLYRYNPFAPDTPQQRHGLQPTPVMTSVGLLMRLYLGWDRDQPAMQAGADYLLQHLPENGTIDQPRRDTYYWYYATQVIFHVGGDHWRIWHDRLYPLLIGSQVADGPLAGSWDPDSPTPDLWGRWGGRLYVTTMNLLSLEVSYRHLPLYDATAQ